MRQGESKHAVTQVLEPRYTTEILNRHAYKKANQNVRGEEQVKSMWTF